MEKVDYHYYSQINLLSPVAKFEDRKEMID